MTIEEVIKANELCAELPSKCEKCPYYGVKNDDCDCVEMMTADTVYFLKSIKADLEDSETNIVISLFDEPWEVACKIINAEYTTTNIFDNEIKEPFFDIDELKKIGEHIVNWCNTEKEGENNGCK